MSAREEFTAGLAEALDAASTALSVEAARAHLFGFVEAGATESDLPSFAAALDEYAAAVRAGVRAESLLQAADEIEATADELERTLGRRLETCAVERGVAGRIRRMATRPRVANPKPTPKEAS